MSCNNFKFLPLICFVCFSFLIFPQQVYAYRHIEVKDPHSELNVEDFVSKDNVLLVENSSNTDAILVLPQAASSDGLIFNIKKIDDSKKAIVVRGQNVGETIDGQLAISIPHPNMSLRLLCDGQHWWII